MHKEVIMLDDTNKSFFQYMWDNQPDDSDNTKAFWMITWLKDYLKRHTELSDIEIYGLLNVVAKDMVINLE